MDVFGFHVVSTQSYNNCKDIATTVKKHFNLWVCVCVCIKCLHCELFPVSTFSPVFCAALCKSLEPYWSFLFFFFLKEKLEKGAGVLPTHANICRNTVYIKRKFVQFQGALVWSPLFFSPQWILLGKLRHFLVLSSGIVLQTSWRTFKALLWLLAAFSPVLFGDNPHTA